MVGLLTQVDQTLAAKVAGELELRVPKAPEKPLNQGVSADANEKDTELIQAKSFISLMVKRIFQL